MSETVNNILCELCGYKCRSPDFNAPFEKCKMLQQAKQQLGELLPVEMANTGIAKRYNKFYHGWNDCVREMREAFNLETGNE